MLFISYRGVFDGNGFQDANTPNQINKALGAGFSCMIDVWRQDDKLYLGNDLPVTEVTANYIKGNKFWINARNSEMQTWITSQPAGLYPNYFWFPYMPPPEYVTASNGKLITPGTVAVNLSSVMFLPEVDDTAMFSMVNIKCYGIISNYLSFIRRMRNEGIWY
jgi:hypothetical protein